MGPGAGQWGGAHPTSPRAAPKGHRWQRGSRGKRRGWRAGRGRAEPSVLPLHGTVFMIQRCLDNCEGSFTACRLLRQERGTEGESINSQFLQVLCTQSVRTPGHPGPQLARGWTGPDREPSGCCWASTGHWSLVTPSREGAPIPPPRCALLLPWHQSGALGTLWRGVALDQGWDQLGLSA